ncbi:MAG: hypothetical protein GY854_19875 [Deltaproteobacteria bacterium]|nr:hypothetical protein [Deltaproteobacteria bacterium]
MANSSQGQTLAYDTETSLGTSAGSEEEIRYNEQPKYSTGIYTGIDNPNVGHAHAYARGDKPIWVEKHKENGLSFPVYIRSSATAGGTPPIAEFFESSGCVIASNTARTTVATDAGDDKEWTLTDDVYGADSSMIAGSIELDDERTYYPVLLNNYTSATKTCNAAMELPQNISTTRYYEMMTTIIPYARQVVSTKTLNFLHSTRGGYGSATDEALRHRLSGCALSTSAELSLVHGEAPTLSLTFHVGKVAKNNNTMTTETFKCAEKFGVIDDDFKFEFGTASASSITRGDKTLYSATIKFGIKTVPIKSEGTGTYAGIEGYMQVPDGPATATITALWDYSWWNGIDQDSAPGENTSQYLGFVQPGYGVPSSTNRPSFAFWMPNAHLIAQDPVKLEFEDEAVIKGTATFEADCAGYDSGVLNADRGAAPWAFAIGGDGTV